MGALGRMGELAYRINDGGQQARQKRSTDEPVQEGQPRRLTR